MKGYVRTGSEHPAQLPHGGDLEGRGHAGRPHRGVLRDGAGAHEREQSAAGVGALAALLPVPGGPLCTCMHTRWPLIGITARMLTILLRMYRHRGSQHAALTPCRL